MPSSAQTLNQASAEISTNLPANFQPVEEVKDQKVNFCVNQNLPYYTLHLIPAALTEKADKEEYLGRIEILIGENIIQTFEVDGHARPDSIVDSLYYPDINFDGYCDFSVVVNSGAKWISRRFFIFDPATEKFVINELSDQLLAIGANNMYADENRHEIYAEYLGPCCPSRYIYQILDNRLVLLEKREALYQVNNDHTATITYTVDRLVNRTLSRIKVWSTTIDPMEDGLWSITDLEEAHPELLN